MANLCCMVGCTSEPTKNLYYFKLPTKPALRRRWLAVIQPSIKLTDDASVCSAHFESTDYETVRGKTRLKKNKVPMKIDVVCAEKTQSTGDHSNHSNDSESDKPDEHTVKPTDLDGNTEDKISKDVEKDAVNDNIDENISRDIKNGAVNDKNGMADEKITDCCKNGTGDELEDKIDSEGGKETEDNHSELGKETEDGNMEMDTIEMNGAQEPLDPNAVEIQITPDIIEDYNPIQVTPDIIDDYDSLKPPDILGPDITHDIEDILTNYHIMNPPSRRDREQPSEQPTEQPEKPRETSDIPAAKPSEKQSINERPSEKHTEKPVENDEVQTIDDDEVHTIDDDEDLPLGVSTKPVFIEIPVDKGRNKESSDRNDCLMVLESLQVSIDPSTMMWDDDIDQIEQIELDDDPHPPTSDKKSNDPISLLTSSDEDEVIIEEPHIDTVEVSDDTDEDDVPLMRLVKPKKCTGDISKLFWGAKEYYCKYCNFYTLSASQYRTHAKTHSATAIQICQVCGFTTASENQFARHKKKHKDDKRYKCHMCDYKARHNMSLSYHLKTHAKDTNKACRCPNCGFKSRIESVILKHMKTCKKIFKCDVCRYSTKRRSDLKRHMLRKHPDTDEDEDTWISD